MKAIGIILAGGNSEKRMGELTESRAAAAISVPLCFILFSSFLFLFASLL